MRRAKLRVLIILLYLTVGFSTSVKAQIPTWQKSPNIPQASPTPPIKDADNDGITDDKDKCPKEPETFNKYQDEDGCPDSLPTQTPTPTPQPTPTVQPTPIPTSTPTPTLQPVSQLTKAPELQPIGGKLSPTPTPTTVALSLPGENGSLGVTINPPTRETVLAGPIFPQAFADGDNDGVLNIFDECPNTPPGKKVLENGCRCQETDGGKNFYEKGTVTDKDEEHTHTQEDRCPSWKTISEYYCNNKAEDLDIDEVVSWTTHECSTRCEDGRCILPEVRPGIVMEAMFLPACASPEGTCADGIQNQDETGIDCGGKCPPCNTNCVTSTKYAPPDTPCTRHFVGGGTYVSGGHRTEGVFNVSNESQSDQHRIDIGWTDGGGECNCQFYEVCDEGLDFVIDEALACCSARNQEEIAGAVDPNLCQEAINESRTNCKRCAGLYIIKGLGSYSRWMRGYFRNRSMEYYVCGAWVEASPSERLINEHQTGICRDYSAAVATLLRKAGFSQREVGNFCDGGHCYNVVKLPGDSKWHVVDTTGNRNGFVAGALPGDYPYCFALNQANWCFNNTKTFDTDRYWESQEGGEIFSFATCVSEPGFTGSHEGYDFNFNMTFSPECGLGLACHRDNYRLPDFAPPVNQIVGCE